MQMTEFAEEVCEKDYLLSRQCRGGWIGTSPLLDELAHEAPRGCA